MGLNRFFARWSSREYFFVVELLGDRIVAVRLSLDKEKTLRVERAWEFPRENASSFRELKHFRGEVMVASESPHATTAHIPVHIERDAPEEPVAAVELENALGTAIGRAFNGTRADAASTLGVEELDVILVGSRVESFKVHGHKVVNPIGFRAKTVSATVALTLTRRDVFETVHELFGARRSFFFTEIGHAEIKSMRMIYEGELGVVRLGSAESSVSMSVHAGGEEKIEERSIPWGASTLFMSLAHEWGVGNYAAAMVYDAYCAGRTSPHIRRFLEVLFKRQFDIFFKELAREKLPRRLFVTVPMALPPSLRLARGRIALQDPPAMLVLAKFGMSGSPEKWPIPERDVFERLAPFFEWYADKSDSTINQWLRRHLNWLGASL